MFLGMQIDSVIDAIYLFNHWRIHPDYRYMQTVISRLGQDLFNASFMGCVDSIANRQLADLLLS